MSKVTKQLNKRGSKLNGIGRTRKEQRVKLGRMGSYKWEYNKSQIRKNVLRPSNQSVQLKQYIKKRHKDKVESRVTTHHYQKISRRMKNPPTNSNKSINYHRQVKGNMQLRGARLLGRKRRLQSTNLAQSKVQNGRDRVNFAETDPQEEGTKLVVQKYLGGKV